MKVRARPAPHRARLEARGTRWWPWWRWAIGAAGHCTRHAHPPHPHTAVGSLLLLRLLRCLLPGDLLLYQPGLLLLVSKPLGPLEVRDLPGTKPPVWLSDP